MTPTCSHMGSTAHPPSTWLPGRSCWAFTSRRSWLLPFSPRAITLQTNRFVTPLPRPLLIAIITITSTQHGCHSWLGAVTLSWAGSCSFPWDIPWAFLRLRLLICEAGVTAVRPSEVVLSWPIPGWTFRTKDSADICKLCGGTLDCWSINSDVSINNTIALLQSSSPSGHRAGESLKQSQFKTQDATWKVVWLVLAHRAGKMGGGEVAENSMEGFTEVWSGLAMGSYVCKWVRELVRRVENWVRRERLSW